MTAVSTNGSSNGHSNGHSRARDLPRARVHGQTLVCEACGSPLDSSDMEDLQRQLEAVKEELTFARSMITQKEVAIRHLKAESDRSLRNDPNYDAAMRVLEYWRDRCMPTARQLDSEKRLRPLLARMKGKDGFPEAELMRAVDGYARFPFTSRQGRVAQGSRKDWHADAELIFREPKMVQRGLLLADRADALGHAPRLSSQPPTQSEPVQASHPSCASESETSSQPSAGSESREQSHPSLRSGSNNERNPSLRSEPGTLSQPVRGSGPSIKSQPHGGSEPDTRSQPDVESELSPPSYPLRGSESSAPSHPTNGNGPTERSHPSNGSGPHKESYPQDLSGPLIESHPTGTSGPQNESLPNGLSVLGQHAVMYAQHGWLVFPCKPGRKEPATKRGLYAAARDAEGVAKYWDRYPDMNVAIRCGSETGIVVLDIDGDIGEKSFKAMQSRFGKNALPPTFMVQTPRGGHHYYFAHPGPEIHCTVGWPGSGMDIRGDGGYVLAPPSMVGGSGSYERVNEDEFDGFSEMPAWLLEEIFRRQERAPKQIDTAQYEQLVERGAAEGNRNDQLISLAGHLWSHGLSPGEVLGFVMLINRERCRPSLPADEVEKLVLSVQRMRGRR